MQRKGFPDPGISGGFSRVGNEFDVRCSAGQQITEDHMPERTKNWLQGQDSNLRSHGYEPRGMTSSLPCSNLSPYHPGLSGALAACCNMRVGDPAIVPYLQQASRLGGESRGPSQSGRGVRHTSKSTPSCGLLSTDRARNALWPVGAFWPMNRKPKHGTLESAGGKIAATRQCRRAWHPG
jgi:hypothetical protein